jgi:hypothetical protein
MSRHALLFGVVCLSVVIFSGDVFAQSSGRILVPESPIVLVNDPPPPPPPPVPDAMPVRPGEDPARPAERAPESQRPSSPKTYQSNATFGELHDLDPYMNNRDVLITGFAGAGGCLAGGVVVGAVSGLTAFFVFENSNEAGGIDGDQTNLVRAGFVGAGGAVFACPVAAGVTVSSFGDNRGHQGSVWLAVLGGFGGLVAGTFGLFIPLFNYVSIPVMTGAGATFGYLMSNRRVQRESQLQPGGGAGAPLGFTVRF